MSIESSLSQIIGPLQEHYFGKTSLGSEETSRKCLVPFLEFGIRKKFKFPQIECCLNSSDLEFQFLFYRVLLFQFALPAIQVILFCICIGADPFNIPLAVVNEDSGQVYSRNFLKQLDSYIVEQVRISNHVYSSILYIFVLKME